MITQPDQNATEQLREALLNACRIYHKNIAGDDEALRLIEDSMVQVLVIAEANTQRRAKEAVRSFKREALKKFRHLSNQAAENKS